MRLPIQIQAILFRKINRETQYLLLKRISTLGRFWQPVTGGTEKGETKIQALKREVLEETGIKNVARIIKDVHYCEFWDYFKREARQRLIKEHAFGVEINSNEKITMSREHTEYRYFTGSTFGTYTRITIGQSPTTKGTMISQLSTPPSANFVDDLWIEKLEGPPASIERAARAYSIRENMLYFIIVWLIVASMLAGSLTGYLMFRDFKKFALIGLANCFTIVGTIIATLAFVEKKRANFIVFFSIIFLLINFLVILPIVAVLIL